MTSLREMASRCEFPGDQLGDRVRDQVVAWCAYDKIRERLLQEPGNRKLDDMVQLALTMERARLVAPCVSSAAEPSVNVVDGHHSNRKHRPLQSSADPVRCWNYNSDEHAARASVCPVHYERCLVERPGTLLSAVGQENRKNQRAFRAESAAAVSTGAFLSST